MFQQIGNTDLKACLRPIASKAHSGNLERCPEILVREYSKCLPFRGPIMDHELLATPTESALGSHPQPFNLFLCGNTGGSRIRGNNTSWSPVLTPFDLNSPLRSKQIVFSPTGINTPVWCRI